MAVPERRMAFVPDRIFIQEGLEQSAVARRAKGAAPGAAVEEFADLAELMARMEGVGRGEAKRCLAVARRAGGFVKEFPTGEGIRSSGWHYFIPAIGCPADCAYCFLRTYHTGGTPIVFAELEAMFEEIEAKSLQVGGGYFYGGELCDNLMLEGVLEIVPRLVELFRRRPEATLELRTKADDVDALIEAAGRGGAPGNVIVSWTFSPAQAAREYEAGAPALERRLLAVKRVARAGYRVGVRLDPVILLPGWREAYSALIGELAAAMEPAAVESVHIGCMRFTPQLKAAAAGSQGIIYSGEFVLASDGKFRYPRPLRTAAYSYIAALIRRWNGTIAVKLCMETPEVHADFKRLCEK